MIDPQASTQKPKSKAAASGSGEHPPHVVAFKEALPQFPVPPEGKQKAKSGESYHSALLAYMDAAKDMAKRHLQDISEGYEYAFPLIFDAWKNGNIPNGDGLTYAHLFDRCKDLGFLKNQDIRRKVLTRLVREKFMTQEGGISVLSQKSFLEKFETAVKDYSKDEHKLEPFELAMLRWTNVSDFTNAGIHQLHEYAHQRRMEVHAKDLYRIFRDRLLDFIRADSQASVTRNQTPDIGDIRTAADRLVAFVDKLPGTDKDLKNEAFETVQSWLTAPEKTLGRESRYTGQKGSVGFFENVTEPTFRHKLKLLPDKIGEDDFEFIASSQIGAYKRPEDILITAAKACIPDEKKRIQAFLDKYVAALSAFIESASREELGSTVKGSFLKELPETIRKVSSHLPSADACQGYFDVLRKAIEQVAAKGKITDQETLDAESYLAKAFLTPEQKIAWIKSLTDSNLALDSKNIQNKESEKLIGFLCNEFERILSGNSSSQVATTGTISAGIIHGELTLFFHKVRGSEASEDGLFYNNCSATPSFESLEAKRDKINGPFSMIPSVCTSAREEFQRIVNAPAETTKAKSPKREKAGKSTPPAPSGHS